jgi:hypothetical protein
MPVQTRSNVKAENLQRDEQSAVQGLINLSLIHPDFMSPPVTPVDENRMHTPPPAPRRKHKRMFVDTSISKTTNVPPPPVLRRQTHHERDELNRVVNINKSQSILSDLRRSTQHLNALLDELEHEHYNFTKEGLDRVTSVLD